MARVTNLTTGRQLARVEAEAAGQERRLADAADAEGRYLTELRDLEAAVADRCRICPGGYAPRASLLFFLLMRRSHSIAQGIARSGLRQSGVSSIELHVFHRNIYPKAKNSLWSGESQPSEREERVTELRAEASARP